MHKRFMHRYLILFSYFLLIPFAYSQEMNKLLERGLSEGITVDLREPTYTNGILTTEKGGVVSGLDLRIQAQKICYTRKIADGISNFTIEAEDDLIVEFGEYIFIGQKLFYDFHTQQGSIDQGKTQSGPWFFGGEVIQLRSDKSYIIYNGYATTSENAQPDWGIFSSRVEIIEDQYIEADQVQLKIFDYPILWIPSLKTNLDIIFDSPIRYRFKWGGRQGPRFGLTYEVFSWQRWKTFVRFDYRLTRGPGGGIEIYYNSLDGLTEFQSINYISKDSSLLNSHEKARFRFEGIFRKELDNHRTNLLLTYDKISDLEMPSNYYDRDFEFETSKRTQFFVRHQEEDWISSFYARVRVNNFQTVKQELPSLYLSSRPFTLGDNGIIVDNWAKTSYLDFKYANNLPHVKNYASTRFEYRPTIYRPFLIGPLNFTPELRAISIFYGDSPDKSPQWLAQGIAGYRAHTQLYRYFGNRKHVIEPYTAYHHYSCPTTPPNDHYIFDIDDGWYQLNQLTVGLNNSLYIKRENCVSRLMYVDLYTFAFFDTPHIKPAIPKLYTRLMFFFTPTLKQLTDAAWDFRHHNISYFNYRLDWTLNADFALAAEFRHRNAYSWRKIDPENFFLDAFHSEKRLAHSQLSDKRDTFLLHLFYRFHPNWACEMTSRYGWNRLTEPGYGEYEINLFTTIQTAWHLKFSFQHQENDTRFAIYVNVGLRQPDCSDCHKTSTCHFE